MKFSVLNSTNPYINLAIEEYLLKYTKEDYFLLWQNEPTVVIGKNQNAFAEVNVDFTREKNIHIARRISGGGAVYHDFGNLNFSFILNKANAKIDFLKYTSPIVSALKKLGIFTEISGRNDILLEGKKISGNAEAIFENRILHHGTLLFDTDIEILTSALRTNKEKIQSKAIKSISSRITNIKRHLAGDYSISDLISCITEYIMKEYSAQIFTPEISQEILALSERNASERYLFPERNFLSSYTLTLKKRYDFGSVCVLLNMKNDKIVNSKIEGDFFGAKDINELELLLDNAVISDIPSILSKLSVSDYIFGMTNEEFFELLKPD